MKLLDLVPWYYRALALAALALALFGYGYLEGFLHEEHKAAEFAAQVKAEGDAQNARTNAAILKGKQDKERSDAEHKVAVAGFVDRIARLRHMADAGGGFVPAAPAGSSRPDLICIDRAEYIRADGEFTAEARGLADEGSKATIDLDAAKKWAQGR
jgi:hypothetical protein